MEMNSRAGCFFPASMAKLKAGPCESDLILEVSPDKRYIRYNEILGRGAFKIVYKGFDEADGLEVAWNQISMDDALHSSQNIRRLYSEVHLLRTLKHGNIMKLYDSWVDKEKKTINMITELFTSGSLRQYRQKHKNVDLKAIKNWAKQILHGLNYLHNHNPPIIHRDLKCDNIFVNGNHGEVKIGDLGLAAAMQQPTARSVIGTPEFMAPELYEEEYNELVDIYSFGMCMLELITCEYPYSECKNQAQIYKKVTSGIKPAALGRVQEPQAKELIEKCLLPASQRLNAAELLKDPFLSFESPKELEEPFYNPMQSVSSKSKSIDTLKDVSLPMDIEPTDKEELHDATVESSFETNYSTTELQKYNGRNEFTLRGERHDVCSISFSLRIADFYGRVRNIHFMFYLYADTATSIAGEMVEQLGLLGEDVVLIAELIDDLIFEILPNWEPSFDSSDGMSCSHKEFDTSGQLSSSYTDEHVSNSIHSYGLLEQDASNEFDFSDKHDHGEEPTEKSCKHKLVSNSDAGEDNAFRIFDFNVIESCKDSKKYEIDLSYGSINESLTTSECTKKLGCECLRKSLLSYIHQHDATPDEMCSSFSSVCLNDADREQEDESKELKLELNAIAMQYDQCCHELLRMREEAMENAKKRWTARKGMPIV